MQISTTTRTITRLYTSFNGLSNFAKVKSISGPFTTLNTEKFRQHAFIPEKPILITSPSGEAACQSFPAATKWFASSELRLGQGTSDRQYNSKAHIELNHAYLEQFQDTILPYEYITPKATDRHCDLNLLQDILRFSEQPDIKAGGFHRFHAPLQLFLSLSSNNAVQQLYIAQAQLIDLPPALRADLPTPNIVKAAGKGDVYDANIWLGRPPTYTPLHKDPNPNLFVQLASRKVARIFEPGIGREVFANIKRQLGESGREGMRGAEMMEGKERELLDEVVWGKDAKGGYEAILQPMDALFIPKGWWHSIKSIGDEVNASVNWWFR